MKDAIQAAEHAAMHKLLPPSLFSGLLAISSDAVIAVDDEQRIIFFNEGAERIFGWAADEVGGRYLEILLPERYRAAHRGHVHGFGAAHGRARLMGERQQLSGLRRDGEEFPCEAAIQRIEVEGRNVFAAVLRDITARQRAEDTVREAVTAREDMLGIVSHDLRNPANAVKMLAKSILDDATRERLPEQITERVAMIQQAAQQMDSLIQDLLDTTRLASGRLRVDPQPMDAGVVVERSVDAMRSLADAARISLEATVPAGLPQVLADADRVSQLFSNLIGNAIKFTPPGGAVTLVVHADGDAVLFVLRDTGVGISAEDLPHVFERFYQGERGTGRTARHGAGLGLPIARGIVEAHGGHIWIDSLPGAGTTVRFYLPVAPPA
ncbi:MAG: domain S-box [Gemmatimonadetes bacterium]|nr:domain S-box [Gemmatimonadota bacterium]